jgi:hypothetical protein
MPSDDEIPATENNPPMSILKEKAGTMRLYINDPRQGLTMVFFKIYGVA